MKLTQHIIPSVWDEKEMEWNTDYIVGDTVYEPEERTVTFQSQKFAPIAMLQSRCTDYPYRHWEFRCTNDQTAILTLETKRGLHLQFEVTALAVMLIENDCPELQHLVN